MKVHIGKIIQQKVKASGMTVIEFARKINYSRRNVYVIFKNESINTALLTKIGKVLDHDFFNDYIRPVSAADRVAEQEMEQYQKQNEKLKSKIESLEKEVDYLREINTLLKTKKKKSK
ncbi:MAG: hypothetical protein ACOZCO_06980 [Bacteroidota bacterium]